jgi:hypothetical protein
MIDQLDPNYRHPQSAVDAALAAIRQKFLAECTPNAWNYGYVVNRSANDPAHWWAEIDHSRRFWYDPQVSN